MPNESVNLYLSIQSGSSERTLTSLTDKTKALDKETQLLQQATQGLANANKPLLEQQTKLQAELKSSQKAVNEAKKAYDEYGDEVSKLRMDTAIEEHARLKQELTEVNNQLGANQKTYKEYLETVRKGGLQASGGASLSTGNGGGPGSSLGSILGGLGIGNMLSGLAENIADQQLSSALGSSMGSAVSGALSSTINGAALGATLGGPIGAVIGGALGGLTGILNGASEVAAEKDDAFIEYYNGLRDQFSGLAAEQVKSGSTIAAGRETDRISFATMFGSEKAADRYLADLVDMSNSTPFLYDDLKAMSKTLATYGYDENSILPVLQTIGDTGAALGMTTSDMTSVATSIGRMVSSDKASLEYLNILNDRGINAVGYLAEARGKSVADTYADISKGNISGAEAAEIILAAMEESYAGSMEAQSKTFAGLTSTLEGLQQEVANAAGEGYNTLRTEGIQDEISTLNGTLGDAMKEMNSIIGKNQAYLENLSERYQRDALTALFTGEISELFDEDQADALRDIHAKYEEALAEYETGDQEAGLKLQSLYELTQETAQSYYESSDIMQEKEDIEIEHLAAIRKNTHGLVSTLYAYNRQLEASKGDASVISPPKDLTPEEQVVQEAFVDMLALDNFMENAPAFAVGLDRVPYDDFPALLHEGERVLTASEARAMDAGGGAVVQITVSGNNFVGTGEEMADQIAEILARKLEGAATVAVPR